MSTRKAYERRVQLATRQSGRGTYRRHLLLQIRCKHDVELPPPPPICQNGKDRQPGVMPSSVASPAIPVQPTLHMINPLPSEHTLDYSTCTQASPFLPPTPPPAILAQTLPPSELPVTQDQRLLSAPGTAVLPHEPGLKPSCSSAPEFSSQRTSHLSYLPPCQIQSGEVTSTQLPAVTEQSPSVSLLQSLTTTTSAHITTRQDYSTVLCGSRFYIRFIGELFPSTAIKNLIKITQHFTFY